MALNPALTRPRPIAPAASGADSVPLNLSGATTTGRAAARGVT